MGDKFVHFFDGLTHPDQHGAGDDAVADVEFTEVFNAGDGLDVAIGQAVAGVNDQSRGQSDVAAVAQLVQTPLDLRIRRRIGVLAGVQFDGIAAGLGGGENLLFVGDDKGTDADAFLVQTSNNLAQPFQLADAVQAAFSGQYSTVFGHKGHLIGTNLLGDLDHLRIHTHLKVEFAGDGFLENPHIPVANMTTIFTQMHGNPVGSGQFTLHRRPDRIRLVRPAGLTNRRHVIDIDIQ